MARPLKKGLSYFPLDTQFWCDRKTQRLKQRYGCDGICVYLSILCEIYGRNGYYADFDSDFCFDIGFTVGLDERRVREIVDFCVHIRLFDGTMLKQQRILTSVGIQSRFEEISKRTGPADVPVGTGSDISSISTPARSNISLLHLNDVMSNAIVRVARE